MKQRVQKIISERGAASRRAAEKMIADGRVTVNGVVVTLGDCADGGDEIAIDGAALPEPDKRVYIMLNKPRGYVTTMSDEQGRKIVTDLVRDCSTRVYPVGRLDLNSEGLLIMTNDGELTHALTHPSHGARKTYRVVVRGDTVAALSVLRGPIDVDGCIVTALEVSRTAANELTITIGEGRNRQVRKMCTAAGLQVVRLVRVAEGGLALGALKSGQWRYLTARETELLRGSVNRNE